MSGPATNDELWQLGSGELVLLIFGLSMTVAVICILAWVVLRKGDPGHQDESRSDAGK